MIYPSNTLYFARHGETDANTLGLMCGSKWDIDLNSAGHKQANQAALAAKKMQLQIDHIFASPLQRARSTAKYFSDILELPIIYFEELKEWDLGEWDTKPSAEISPFFDANEDPINGERLHDFRKRVTDVTKKIYSEYKNSLVVSHGAVWKQLCAHLNIGYSPIANCKIAKIFLEPIQNIPPKIQLY